MAEKKLKWGVLGNSKIARTWLIPSIQSSASSEVLAVGTRNPGRAADELAAYGISKFYNSYETLLQDPEVEVIYNPLPNHLHREWSIKALEAGKHVLCEKPIGLSLADAKQLFEAAAHFPHLKLMEAFMYRFHPQWAQVKDIIASGSLGNINNVHAVFTYCNLDPGNVRNIKDIGGGALLDVGCYCISVARLIYGEAPTEVFADMDLDPRSGVDRLTLGTMRFNSGKAQFRCATQSEPQQSVVISGDKGAQVEAFANAIANGLDAPLSMQDTLENMAAIDALFQSFEIGKWVKPERNILP